MYKISKKNKLKTQKLKYVARRNTFIIDNDSKAITTLDVTYLRNLMNTKYKLQEIKDPRAAPTFLYISEHLVPSGMKYLPTYFNTRCHLMNIISNAKSIITNKLNLYNEMKRISPGAIGMPISYTFTEFMKLEHPDKMPLDKIYIAKPSGKMAFGGAGIIILDGPAKIEMFKKMNSAHKQNFLINEYITNPLLFKGRKFHCRMTFIASSINGYYRTYLLPNGRIVTAKSQYKTADFDNTDIHDSHLKSTDADYNLPNSFPANIKKQYVSITWPKIQEIFKNVSRVLERHCKPYPNAKNAYELFGADVMITDAFEPLLLEVNEHPSYKTVSAMYASDLAKYTFKYLENSVFAVAGLGDGGANEVPLYESKL